MRGIANDETSVSDAMENRCPDCKGPLYTGYGMAGGGMGVYEYCERCDKIVNKWQDHEATECKD
jgi:hypothetical protein